jgi:hypothetical protein
MVSECRKLRFGPVMAWVRLAKNGTPGTPKLVPPHLNSLLVGLHSPNFDLVLGEVTNAAIFRDACGPSYTIAKLRFCV